MIICKDMSYLANAIDELLNEHKTNGADLARKTGLNAAQISRWKNAAQKSIKPDCLLKLAQGFSKSPETHSRLLYAHLLDERTGPGAKFISIELSNQALHEEPVPYQIKLAPSIQKDLDIITSRISNDRRVRDLVAAVAQVCRGEPLPQAHSK
jgi:DNA-binding Xre family transcriptional regulator